jgi:hypothetical protein
MQTVTFQTPKSKTASTTIHTAAKAFRATLRDEAGILAKVDGEILFFSDAGELISIEPEDCVWLCVLGEVGLYQTQELLDNMRHGAARIACSRPMERQ